jgi:hypothetical protein
MLTKEDILNQINEIGEENLTTNLQIKKLEQSIPIQEFSFKGYVKSLDEKNGNIKLELFDRDIIFNKDAVVIVSLLHPVVDNSFDFTNFNLKDEVKIICTFKKININTEKDYLYNEFYKIYISLVNLTSIELLKTAKEIEEEERKTEKVEESKREKKQEEWRKMNDAATAKAELEKAAWWLKILIIPGILFLLFIYWFFNM